MSVLHIFSSKPGIPNPSAFAADQDIILAVFEKLHPAYSLSFVDHLLYFILCFYLVCLLYTLKLLVFPI